MDHRETRALNALECSEVTANEHTTTWVGNDSVNLSVPEFAVIAGVHGTIAEHPIVKRVEAERTTASGIVIPDSAGEKPDQGEVVAVGNGKIQDNGEVRPMAVKAGDRVLFGKYAGQAVKVDGDELLVMREEDIMGVVES